MAKTEKMKYLIDIGHPAHVHYFKNFAKIMNNKGHKVLFTCRDKEVTLSLLKYYRFNFISLGKPFKSSTGKIFGLMYFALRILMISIKFKPDFFLNASVCSAVIAWLLRKPHFSLEDTFNKEQVNLYMPFTSCVLTGDYEHPQLGRKEVIYRGYQELLYLHPKYFTPDESILHELGVQKSEPYVIIRFVSWNASHDFGHKGISYPRKLQAVTEFAKYARVFISSEAELPEEFKQYKIEIAPHRMHDAIAFASLVMGESFTMLSEAAVLGTPAVLIHNTKCHYIQEQQTKYGLAFNYTESDEDQAKAVEKGVELLKMTALKTEWKKRADKIFADKIDVTAFLVWFVENFPQSMKTMKENPAYQNNFK